MGWNSWDSYGTTVTETQVKANADAMARDDIRFPVLATRSHDGGSAVSFERLLERLPVALLVREES